MNCLGSNFRHLEAFERLVQRGWSLRRPSAVPMGTQRCFRPMALEILGFLSRISGDKRANVGKLA